MRTATLNDGAGRKKRLEPSAEAKAAAELVRAAKEQGNIRNGKRPKTVLIDASGPVRIDVPRDRASTFEPQIVRKRQRRLSGATR